MAMCKKGCILSKVFTCVGTRADIIKMSSILCELSKTQLDSYVCVSGQHQELALTVLEELHVNYNVLFDIMKDEQTLDYVLSKLIEKYSNAMRDVKPKLVLVHGDTTTALAGALSASYQNIPIFYIEAGLRTYSDVPFPEELHRRLITNCSTFFACPDEHSAQNLILEHVDSKNIYITGNSIIDVIYNSLSDRYVFKNGSIKENQSLIESKVIVVTMHRHELSENALRGVCRAIKNVAQNANEVSIFWPVHPNPRIKNVIYQLWLFAV
jgi:UDP-N-acetylglucosamine 2-epimerase (non-hydrolysing)